MRPPRKGLRNPPLELRNPLRIKLLPPISPPQISIDNSIMAGIKRKEAPNAQDNSAIAEKKAKKKIAAVQEPETLTPPSTVSNARASNDVEAGSDYSSTDEAAILGPSAQERGEAETDSDPIAESDTTENSGEDDGISWPSDDEEEVPVVTSKTQSKVGKGEDAEDVKLLKGNGVAKGSNDASTGRKMFSVSPSKKKIS